MGTDDIETTWQIAHAICGKFGGASRDRTDDLLHAMQALSQLSYSPSCGCGKWSAKRGAKVRDASDRVKPKGPL